jgi:hypothetical protein
MVIMRWHWRTEWGNGSTSGQELTSAMLKASTRTALM